ncbi:DUF1467 family protein [Pseudoroseomonas globiformis]|uniref:DUF1467 family protein n=1 Tax=Teichococcus globiformis TaxID=2307229 RepID=A0ABV7FZ84_9PROT
MNWFTGIMVFVLVWWVMLFTVLPVGIRPDEDGVTGGWRGTPRTPRIGRKLLWTTLLACGVFGCIYLLATSDLLSFREGWLALNIT